MEQPTQISIPVDPIGKPRQTRSDKWKQRPAVMRYRQFCDDVRGYLPNYQLPGELHLTFFIPMPASWSKKRKAEMLGAPHTAKPDVDNIAKAWMDAFKGDDSHVYSLHAEKYWALQGSIELEPDDYALKPDLYVETSHPSHPNFWVEVNNKEVI